MIQGQISYEMSHAFLEYAWIEPFSSTIRWRMSWGFYRDNNERCTCRVQYAKSNQDLVEMILTELERDIVQEAWFNQEILDLDPQIIAALVARELLR